MLVAQQLVHTTREFGFFFNHTMALPFILKCILKAKGELWKLKYFTMNKYNLQSNDPLNETKILQKYYNSIITNLQFQHKPKYHLSKILI
jgi:hypothetical protein